MGGFKSGCSPPTLSSTGAFSALLARRSMSGEHAQAMGLRSWPLGCEVLIYGQNTDARARWWSRDGLYGLADLTCLATLIGGASHRSVDARRSSDELRRSPSAASMNSTISLLGECSRRRLTHLTLAGLTFLDRTSAPATLGVSHRAALRL